MEAPTTAPAPTDSSNSEKQKKAAAAQAKARPKRTLHVNTLQLLATLGGSWTCFWFLVQVAASLRDCLGAWHRSAAATAAVPAPAGKQQAKGKQGKASAAATKAKAPTAGSKSKKVGPKDPKVRAGGNSSSSKSGPQLTRLTDMHMHCSHPAHRMKPLQSSCRTWMRKSTRPKSEPCWPASAWQIDPPTRVC